MGIEEYIKQIRENADAYENTIQTIISFDSAVRWDDSQERYFENSFFLPGRKLLKNLTKPDDHVRPDIVIQLSNEYGIVSEVKITASSNRDFENAYKQIQNYDADLIGWKTNNEKIELHDITLLIDDLNKVLAKNYFEGKNFQRKFALIACARQYYVKQICKIEKYFGELSDGRIENKLSNIVAVPLEKEEIIKKISKIKFYDAKPPLEYTMNVLWMNIFNEIAEKEAREKVISVDCYQVTDMLRERYSFEQIDSRQPKRPMVSWIREALDTFVKIDYASKDPTNRNKYLIRYVHKRKDDMLELFSRKHFEVQLKDKKKALEGKQLEMGFDEE
jgi:hypothetical protein